MEQKFHYENADSVVVAKTFDFNKTNFTVIFLMQGHSWSYF